MNLGLDSLAHGCQAAGKVDIAPASNGCVVLVFDEIKSYMGFSETDARRVKEARVCLEGEFPKVVDAFYEALNANPRSRAVFDGPEQVERLRVTLYGWLDEIFSGEYDNDFFTRHHRIGRKHVEVGLLPHFMFGAMNIVRTELIEHIYDCSDDLSEDPIVYIEAIDRLLDLELTIMLQSYWDAMMEMKLKVPAALASGLAHEIRNPLNALGLNITLLERKFRSLNSPEVEGAAALLEAMRSEIRRITNLTTEIMDFAKPIELSLAWHDGRNLIESMRTTFGGTMEASGIDFHTEFKGDLAEIHCDMDRMKQVFFNLLSNAIEAVSSPGAEIHFSIENYAQGTTFTVADNGQGIPASKQYRMFDLFFTSKSTGTGLGLPIVKKIVEAHDGAVDVQSKVGEGTSFRIHIPRPTRS